VSKYKNKYRIETNRHQYWDYSRPGGYYITINTHNRDCFLGNISYGKMHLSPFGQVVHDEILRIPTYHEQVQIGASVVMPDHIHLIVDILDMDDGLMYDRDVSMDRDGIADHADDTGGDDDDRDDTAKKIHEFSLPPRTIHPTPPRTTNVIPTYATDPDPWYHNPNHKPTIDEIKQYRKQRRKMIIPKIIGKMKMVTSKQINILRGTPQQKNWQANYHDRIIPDDNAYQRILKYINDNPANWKK